MRDQRPVWCCEFAACGHVWLAMSEVPPEKCSRCRRRGWHQTKTVRELVAGSADRLEERMRQIAHEVYSERDADQISLHQMPQDAPLVVAAGYPTPQNAPSVIHGEVMPVHRAVPSDDLRAIVQATAPPEAPLLPCLYTEYDGTTGETYRCGLPEHSSKVKHTRGERL